MQDRRASSPRPWILLRSLGEYIVEGAVRLDGADYEAGSMLVLRAGDDARVVAERGARFALIGGASLGLRYLYWNFVSSNEERIDSAKGD